MFCFHSPLQIFSCTPQARRIIEMLVYLLKKKRGESLFVTRPTQRGLRITQYRKTSNANTHAHVIILKQECSNQANLIHQYINTSWASIVAISLTVLWNLRSFSVSKTKRVINAFLEIELRIYSITLSTDASVYILQENIPRFLQI